MSHKDHDQDDKSAPHWSIPLMSSAERWLSYFPPLSRTKAAIPEPRHRRQARREIMIALLWGGICHILFAGAVLAMIIGMWFGMSRAQGTIPYPWSWIANCLLLLQFPLVHSLLLTGMAQRFLGRLAPGKTGATLSTTTFAIIASIQLLALFVWWTPSGIIFWQAGGWALWLIATLYTLSWLFLVKASWDAGAEVQSGVLGWMSLIRGVKPHYPPMPVTGTFQFIRHPIYLAFALTTWTVPTWTPDQLLLASVLTLYCALGPLAKEWRFQRRYGADWQRYKLNTPFWIPRLRKTKHGNPNGLK